MPSSFSTECVAEFECIFEYDTMRPETPRVERLAHKHGLTKAQVFSWFGYRRRKALKANASSTPAETYEAVNVLPARGSQYSDAARAMFTAEQLAEMEMADEADRAFMDMLVVA